MKSLWLKVLGETVYRRMVIVERRLDEPIVDIVPRVPIEIALLKEGAVDEYRRFRPQDSLDDVHRWLCAGRVCFVARHEGRIVHTCWVSRGPTWIDYLAFELPLGQDEVCACASFTAPAFRGLDIAPARLTHTLRYLRDAGYSRMVSLVVHGNRASLHYSMHGGYRVIGTVSRITLGPGKWIVTRTIPGVRRPGMPSPARVP
jgi:GNAT superfamily N-acetyltransferase